MFRVSILYIASEGRLMEEHGAVYNVEFIRGDFPSNLVIMAVVLNEMFDQFWDGCSDVDEFGEIPKHVIKSYLNLSVQKL
ncbi:hypothetical protein AVEN_91173-1 [Araneus ventricosus]|uniref:Uncharacterized protein n=1 Tax=Araneus ventricosus TaxID=182803 RepID=A0A4Y2W9A6_ARAVE|nr:hypothetical protein AVEN_91173-1 [Araneus ventricosus]